MQIFCVLLLLSMQTFQDLLLREISNTLSISVLDSSLTGMGYGEGEAVCVFCKWFISGKTGICFWLFKHIIPA